MVLFHAVLPYSQVTPWWYVIDAQPVPQAIYFILFFSAFCLYAVLWRRATDARPVSGKAGQPSRRALLTGLSVFGMLTALAYALTCSFIEGTVWVTVGSLFQVQPAKVHVYLAFFLLGVYVERRDW